MENKDIKFMQAALELAHKAADIGEIPVGALIVAPNGDIIAKAYNLRETEKNATAHAEILAIEAACKALGGWRLPRCTLYVTMEPCPMCTGAIINARIDEVIFGAYDPKAGCCGSMTDLPSLPFNHKVTVRGGVLQTECKDALSAYFRGKRKK